MLTYFIGLCYVRIVLVGERLFGLVENVALELHNGISASVREKE